MSELANEAAKLTGKFTLRGEAGPWSPELVALFDDYIAAVRTVVDIAILTGRTQDVGTEAARRLGESTARASDTLRAVVEVGYRLGVERGILEGNPEADPPRGILRTVGGRGEKDIQ